MIENMERSAIELTPHVADGRWHFAHRMMLRSAVPRLSEVSLLGTDYG